MKYPPNIKSKQARAQYRAGLLDGISGSAPRNAARKAYLRRCYMQGFNDGFEMQGYEGTALPEPDYEAELEHIEDYEGRVMDAHQRAAERAERGAAGAANAAAMLAAFEGRAGRQHDVSAWISYRLYEPYTDCPRHALMILRRAGIRGRLDADAREVLLGTRGRAAYHR